MTDLVERLRKGWRECSPDDIREAADEIERLRMRVNELEMGVDTLIKEIFARD